MIPIQLEKDDATKRANVRDERRLMIVCALAHNGSVDEVMHLAECFLNRLEVARQDDVAYILAQLATR